MALVALVLLLALVVLLGIGLAIGLVVAASVGALLAAGVVSTAALVGVRQRSWFAAFRVAVYQCLVILGTAGGAGVGLAAKMFFDGRVSGRIAVLAGTCGGAVAGLLVAWAALTAWRIAAARFAGRERGFEVVVPPAPNAQV